MFRNTANANQQPHQEPTSRKEFLGFPTPLAQALTSTDIVGPGSMSLSPASIAACRSYLSAATTVDERTTAVSMISLFQVLGFIIGPALQAVVVPLGSEGVWLVYNRLRLNMYTASGWINVFLSILNFCCFFPAIFKERRIAAKEAMQQQGVTTEKETWKGTKPDYLSAWTLIVAFFVIVFNFMLLETLGTSLTMDQFAWTKAEALYYMGILMSVGAVIACVCFGAINPLSKRFPEVKVMIWGGFLFMVLGRGVYIPWGDGPPAIYNETQRLTIYHDKTICNSFYANITGEYDFNGTDNVNSTDWNCNNVTELVGCPSSQTWCYSTRRMTLFQFILGYALTAIGYPIGVTLIQTIFSKILGPRPQGVWMGLMTGSGCFSRVLGPVFVTYIYTKFGTNWTFGMTTIMMILIMVWLLIFNKRLEPKPLVKVEQQTECEKEMQEIKNLIHAPSSEVSVKL
ncbi:Major Facilitator Superfamily [Popillia japonica]|uniref:Major Facilitator Superfamily n=1 Tax=Popillia japonica TaxID=7064 RepID=A0AAW1IU13_POPJA